jgi:hypothetical protein
MIIIIDKNVTVNQLQDGSVVVTRPSIMGKVASHTIKSPYKAIEIATWLAQKLGYVSIKSMLIQEAFPDMGAEDREFLISGITPDAWNAMFPAEDDANDIPAGEQQ